MNNNNNNSFLIDFDEASKQWRKNKIYLGNGIFRYKCHINNCQNILYCYTTEHKQFNIFATEFDLLNKSNPNRYKFCEEHL